MKKYLVVGGGLIGQSLGRLPEFDLTSHESWFTTKDLDKYDGYVCAAALSNNPYCQKVTWQEVVEANVNLPVSILHVARKNGKPFVALSTSGLYRQPGFRNEQDDIEPHNRYTASKIMMEYALGMDTTLEVSPCYIFRIPFVFFDSTHINDMEARVSQWPQCEDVETSIIYKKELHGAILAALLAPYDNLQGIYNLSSEEVLLAKFVRDKLNYRGEIVPAHSMGRTPSTCLDVTKANNAGLI